MELMSLRNMGFDTNLLETLHDLLDFSDESNQASHQTPSRQYVREAKAMAATPADVKETPTAYVFVVDVPGLRPDMINVQLEEDNVLVVSGERRREKERDQGIRYLRMERRLGKYLKKFVLPENADIEKISAECQDGVLTVTVEKRPPPEPKKPKTVQVPIKGSSGGKQDGEGGRREGGKGGGQWGQGGGEGGEQGRQGGQGGGQGEQGRQGGQSGGQGRQGGEGGGQGEHGSQGGQSGGQGRQGGEGGGQVGIRIGYATGGQVEGHGGQGGQGGRVSDRSA